MQTIAKHHIEPQSGLAIELRQGQILTIIDTLGEQVSDLVAFGREDTSEWLSSGRTFDYNNTIRLTTGHVLYSNRSRPMLTIVEDQVGKHDFLYTPCSPETFRILYDNPDPHPSCFDNLVRHLGKFGIRPHQIPTAFNIFMNVDVLHDGELRLSPPLSKAGEYIRLLAEMDLLIGLTACSAEMSNNYSFKPIDVEVHG